MWAPAHLVIWKVHPTGCISECVVGGESHHGGLGGAGALVSAPFCSYGREKGRILSLNYLMARGTSLREMTCVSVLRGPVCPRLQSLHSCRSEAGLRAGQVPDEVH
jgi:hypothetical protein